MIDLGGCEWVLYAIVGAFVLRVIGLGIGGGGRDENQEVIDALNKAIPAAQAETLKNLTARVPSYEAQDALEALKGQYEYDGQYYKWRR